MCGFLSFFPFLILLIACKPKTKNIHQISGKQTKRERESCMLKVCILREECCFTFPKTDFSKLPPCPDVSTNVPINHDDIPLWP